MAPLKQQDILTPLASKLLLSKSALLCWLHVHRPMAYSVFERDEDTAGSLCHASIMGLVQVVQHLLRSGCDPNGSAARVALPLQRAMIGGHEKVFSMLLNHGGNVNLKDYSGYSPLHYAVEQARVVIVRLLLEYGADANSRELRGWTPLHFAGYHDHEEIASILIHFGAEVDATTEDNNQTPLHWAAWNNSDGLLDLRLEHGADINAKNGYGETALHYAAGSNQSFLRYLLEKEADSDIKMDALETPLHWAASGENTQSVELLLSAGANIVSALWTLESPRNYSAFQFLLDFGLVKKQTRSSALLALQESAWGTNFPFHDC